MWTIKDYSGKANQQMKIFKRKRPFDLFLNCQLATTISQLLERWASDRKVAGSRSDSRTGNASLRLWKRHYARMEPSIVYSLSWFSFA